MVRYLRPRILAKVVNPLVVRLGPVTTLTVFTPTTRRPLRLPAKVLDSGGRRYLVCGTGDADWVRELRSAGSCEVRRRGWTQRFRVVELPPGERAPLLAQCRPVWSRSVWSRSARSRTGASGSTPADRPVFELRAPTP